MIILLDGIHWMPMKNFITICHFEEELWYDYPEHIETFKLKGNSEEITFHILTFSPVNDFA